MNILVLGITGMLGSAVFKMFHNDSRYQTWGTLRNSSGRGHFPESAQQSMFSGVDVLDMDCLITVFSRIKPDVVINCVGLIKQLDSANDPLVALPVNSMLPHRLAILCEVGGARLVHISTDCVYSGRVGNYVEEDPSDAEDLYGRSKYIGELNNYINAVTLRTSIIGHELSTKHALLEWFLAQDGEVKGYKNAIFSGLPTYELARVIKDFVLPVSGLSGLFHVSATPISKFDLLNLISTEYGKKIKITPSADVNINRSLNSDRFTRATGYVAPRWPDLISGMRKHR
jgi:dTDP-4-dehydrorhamnose reductase